MARQLAYLSWQQRSWNNTAACNSQGLLEVAAAATPRQEPTLQTLQTRNSKMPRCAAQAEKKNLLVQNKSRDISTLEEALYASGCILYECVHHRAPKNPTSHCKTHPHVQQPANSSSSMCRQHLTPFVP